MPWPPDPIFFPRYDHSRWFGRANLWFFSRMWWLSDGVSLAGAGRGVKCRNVTGLVSLHVKCCQMNGAKDDKG